MVMKIEDYPPTFISKLNNLRIHMNRNIEDARKVEGQNFLRHILAKLPKGEKGQLSAYELHKEGWESQIETKASCHLLS